MWDWRDDLSAFADETTPDWRLNGWNSMNVGSTNLFIVVKILQNGKFKIIGSKWAWILLGLI
ncbi:MAG: hypothetical protein ACK5L8_01215 [Marinicella pacifica]